MKKVLIIIGLLFLFILKIESQENLLSFNLLSVRSIKNEIKIKFELCNQSDKYMAVYVPNYLDICRNIFTIKFISNKDSTIHIYFPCNWIADLKPIKLNCKNCVILPPMEKKVISMKLLKKNFSPYLKVNNLYSVLLEIRLKEVDIESVSKNYFHDDIVSNCLIYKNISVR